jgi:hypothetical protein
MSESWARAVSIIIKLSCASIMSFLGGHFLIASITPGGILFLEDNPIVAASEGIMFVVLGLIAIVSGVYEWYMDYREFEHDRR